MTTHVPSSDPRWAVWRNRYFGRTDIALSNTQHQQNIIGQLAWLVKINGFLQFMASAKGQGDENELLRRRAKLGSTDERETRSRNEDAGDIMDKIRGLIFFVTQSGDLGVTVVQAKKGEHLYYFGGQYLQIVSADRSKLVGPAAVEGPDEKTLVKRADHWAMVTLS
ncbi:hypothetical protein E2P81_ATG10594 [Venturia nashicola]|nr:hypothetical protein E2P81_ATG10594 [Venturia nashicola]